MTVRIAQLTDLHVADWSDLRARDLLSKRVAGWANYRLRRATEHSSGLLRSAVQRVVEAAPDLVIVSGDLSNVGMVSELRAARTLLEPISRARIPLAVVPGNHDYYVRECAEGRFEAIFADWQNADVRSPRGAPYPYVVRARDVSVLLLSSARPTATLMAWGELGASQLADAREMALAERQGGRALVIALHHHPIRAPDRRIETFRDLRDAASLRALATDVGATLIVHGHNHTLHVRRIGGSAGPIVSGMPSSTNTRLRASRRACIPLYEFTGAVLDRMLVSTWTGSDFSEWRPFDIASLQVAG